MKKVGKKKKKPRPALLPIKLVEPELLGTALYAGNVYLYWIITTARFGSCLESPDAHAVETRYLKVTLSFVLSGY